MNTIQLDFEQARGKHLLFKSQVRALLYGVNIEDTPIVLAHECSVGKWIYSHALGAYGHIPEMKELEQVHVNLHEVAMSLVELYRQGKVSEARSGLERMEDIADKLVALLSKVEEKLEGKEEIADRDGLMSIRIEDFHEILKTNIELDRHMKEQVKETESANLRYEQKALQEKASSQLLRNFFMQAPALLSIVRGPNHVFELANPNYTELVGRDVVGKSVREAFPDLEGQGFFELLDNVYQTGKPFIANEMPVTIDRDGKSLEIFVNLMYQALRENGEIAGILSFAYEVTEQVTARKEVEESAKKFQFMAESMPQKIFTATPDGDVDYFNPQWTEFTGLSLETIRDWGWTQFIHPDDVEENIRAWNHSLKTKTHYEIEHRFRKHNGDYHWHLTRAIPMLDGDGEVIKWFGSNTDIQGQKENIEALKESEAMLKRSYEDLETKVKFRNLDLEKLNKTNEAKIAELEEELERMRKG